MFLEKEIVVYYHKKAIRVGERVIRLLDRRNEFIKKANEKTSNFYKKYVINTTAEEDGKSKNCPIN